MRSFLSNQSYLYWTIYIRPPLVFWESSESFGKERDIEHEIFEPLRHATTMGGFEDILQGLWKH
jgi:hypothetical protein